MAERVDMRPYMTTKHEHLGSRRTTASADGITVPAGQREVVARMVWRLRHSVLEWLCKVVHARRGYELEQPVELRLIVWL